MAEIKVQCPGCDASVKAQPGVPKIRCPRCRTVITVIPEPKPPTPTREPATPEPGRTGSAERPASSKSPSSTGSIPTTPKSPPKPLGGMGSKPPAKPLSSSMRPSPPPKKPADDEVFEVGDDDWEEVEEAEDIDEFEEERPSRRSGSASKSKDKVKKSKKRRPAAQAVSDENRQKLMSFGLLLMGLGAASFVLPLIGLQIKGLHRMTPEQQMMGGGMLIAFGALALVFSFLGSIPGFADMARSGFKWGCLAMAGSGLLACGGIAGCNMLRPMFRGNNVAPAQAPFGPGAQNWPGGNPAGMPGPGMTPPNMVAPEQQFAEFGPSQILNVTLLGFPTEQAHDLQEKIRVLTGARISQGSGGGARYQIRMAPVGDITALANQIDFATVRAVNQLGREITLIPKSDGTTTPSSAPADLGFGTAAGGADTKAMPKEDSPFKPATPAEESPFKPAAEGDSPFKPADGKSPQAKPSSDGDSPFKPADGGDSPFKPAEDKASPFKPVEGGESPFKPAP